MFEVKIREAQSFIERLTKKHQEGFVDALNNITNEEFLDWFDGVSELVTKAFPNNEVKANKWKELVEKRTDMIAQSINEGNSIPGYIAHLRRCIQHLHMLDSELSIQKVTKNSENSPESVDSLFKLLMKLLGKLPQKIRNISLSIVILAIVGFAVWGSLPEKTKEKLLDKINNKTSHNIDDQNVLNALKEHLADEIPFYGDSVEGNVKPQMISYLEAYKISRNPRLLKELSIVEAMVEKKSYPANSSQYFDADNDFRAALDKFRQQVRLYTNTGDWK